MKSVSCSFVAIQKVFGKECRAFMSWKDNRRANLTIQAIVNILESEGLDPALCLQGTGLEVEQILNVDSNIPDHIEIQVIEKALSILPQKIGYGFRAGQVLSMTHFGIWGLAILTSPNVRSALEAMSSFSDTSIVLSRISYRERNGRVAFVLDMRHLPVSIHRFMFERYYFVTLQFLQEMIPDYDLAEFELHLPFSDPDYAGELAAQTGLKVITNQPHFAIVASTSLLDAPLPNTDPVAHAHFVTECEGMLNENKKLLDCAQKIRNYILQEKNFSPKLSDVAHSLFISERTLRRRLQEENHSFQEVVLDTKMTLAKELLLAASLPVKVIATRLDYSESASFLRAFKKWWGVSPAEMRASYAGS